MCAVVLEFNLGLLQIEACEETSIVPKGSDIEILPSANNNSSSFKECLARININVKGSLKKSHSYYWQRKEDSFFLLKFGFKIADK